MLEKRKPISKFIKTTWLSMNIRAGKYRHLSNNKKNKAYNNINIYFSRDEFKTWCLNQELYILSLKRPSIDRIDSSKHYSLDNIQVIELALNIKKKRPGSRYLNGDLSNEVRGFRKSGNKYIARITISRKETHLGTFDTKKEAIIAFKTAYYNHYGKLPY